MRRSASWIQIVTGQRTGQWVMQRLLVTTPEWWWQRRGGGRSHLYWVVGVLFIISSFSGIVSLYNTLANDRGLRLYQMLANP